MSNGGGCSRSARGRRRGRLRVVGSSWAHGGGGFGSSCCSACGCGSSNSACSACSSGPGFVPRPSSRARRADSYAASASAPRPVSRRARMWRACRSSSYGWASVSSFSSGTRSGAWPRSRSASMRARVASRRVATVRSGRSARAGPQDRGGVEGGGRGGRVLAGEGVLAHPYEAFELEQVDVRRGGGEAIAAVLRDDRGPAEGAAQAADKGLECGGRRVGRRPTPRRSGSRG